MSSRSEGRKDERTDGRMDGRTVPFAGSRCGHILFDVRIYTEAGSGSKFRIEQVKPQTFEGKISRVEQTDVLYTRHLSMQRPIVTCSLNFIDQRVSYKFFPHSKQKSLVQGIYENIDK